MCRKVPGELPGLGGLSREVGACLVLIRGPVAVGLVATALGMQNLVVVSNCWIYEN